MTCPRFVRDLPITKFKNRLTRMLNNVWGTRCGTLPVLEEKTHDFFPSIQETDKIYSGYVI